MKNSLNLNEKTSKINTVKCFTTLNFGTIPVWMRFYMESLWQRLFVYSKNYAWFWAIKRVFFGFSILFRVFLRASGSLGAFREFFGSRQFLDYFFCIIEVPRREFFKKIALVMVLKNFQKSKFQKIIWFFQNLQKRFEDFQKCLKLFDL